MSHDHHHHAGDNEKRLLEAVILTATFMLAEVVGGVISGSLALLADAGHMLTDSASLLLALWAARLARRPADVRQTYGYHRVQVLAAFVNGLALLLIVAWIAIEAVRRLFEPVAVTTPVMLIVAFAGLVVNLVVFWRLHSGAGDNINVRGALIHVMGDLLGSVAAIVAALVIMATGWMPIDPLLSLLVAVLIARSGWKITRQSAHILLEGAPAHIDSRRLARDIPAALEDVCEVHHVHVWSLTPERPMITLHAILREGAEQDRAVLAIRHYLSDHFNVAHTTVQVERSALCRDLTGRASH